MVVIGKRFTIVTKKERERWRGVASLASTSPFTFFPCLHCASVAVQTLGQPGVNLWSAIKESQEEEEDAEESEEAEEKVHLKITSSTEMSN